MRIKNLSPIFLEQRLWREDDRNIFVEGRRISHQILCPKCKQWAEMTEDEMGRELDFVHTCGIRTVLELEGFSQ